jgi:ribonucleoside-diphosphate reductase beta chain
MSVPLFTERIPYKPFEYPEYYTEGWLKQAQAFLVTYRDTYVSGDVKDWNEKLTPEEKNLVGNILLGFAQTECAVSLITGHRKSCHGFQNMRYSKWL